MTQQNDATEAYRLALAARVALDRVSVVVFLGLLRPIRSSAGGALRRFVRADGAGIIAHGDVDQPIPPVLAADKATHDRASCKTPRRKLLRRSIHPLGAIFVAIEVLVPERLT